MGKNVNRFANSIFCTFFPNAALNWMVDDLKQNDFNPLTDDIKELLPFWYFNNAGLRIFTDSLDSFQV